MRKLYCYQEKVLFKNVKRKINYDYIYSKYNLSARKFNPRCIYLKIAFHSRKKPFGQEVRSIFHLGIDFQRFKGRRAQTIILLVRRSNRAEFQAMCPGHGDRDGDGTERTDADAL